LLKNLLLNRNLIWLFFILIFSPFEKTQAQTVQVINFNSLQKIYSNKSDTTYFINFFASWCLPCLSELPDFVSFSEQHKNEKVKMIFVSLDMKKDSIKTLPQLIEKFKINEPVFLLDENNADKLINLVDKKWSGSIPATLILNNKKKYKKFFAQSMSLETLNKLIK